MAHEVWIPALHRDLTGGVEQVTVTGETVGMLVDELERAFPGLRDRLCDEARLRPGISVVVDGVVAPRGLRQRLPESSEVHFVPAISGGAEPD